MMAIDDRRVEKPPGSIPSAVQQLVECRLGDRIRCQASVRLTDRAVGLLPVMPREMLISQVRSNKQPISAREFL